jgi:hypothetical protein
MDRTDVLHFRSSPLRTADTTGAHSDAARRLPPLPIEGCPTEIRGIVSAGPQPRYQDAVRRMRPPSISSIRARSARVCRVLKPSWTRNRRDCRRMADPTSRYHCLARIRIAVTPYPLQ